MPSFYLHVVLLSSFNILHSTAHADLQENKTALQIKLKRQFICETKTEKKVDSH